MYKTVLLCPLSFNTLKGVATPWISFIMSVNPTTDYNIEGEIPVLSEKLLINPFILLRNVI